MTTPVVVLSNLQKRFGDIHAVNDVSLYVNPGETYGLLGPNGAGKTTTISILAGLLEPDAGTVTVAGTTIRARSTDGKSAIGLVPQDLAIYPDLTAEENLEFFAKLYGMSKQDGRNRIAEILDVISLNDRKGDRVDTYSGGMKRRLNIGIGMLHSPTLLILDEPTVGVDPQSRNAILESVEALSSKGMAVAYTTHYMEEAERLCDRIGIIDDGQIIAEGTTPELVSGIGQHERIRVEISGDAGDALDGVRALEGIRELTQEDHTVAILADDGSRRLPDVLSHLTSSGLAIASVDVTRPDLEAVFLHLTGKALRE